MKKENLYLLGPAGSFSDEASELLKGGAFQKRYVSSFRQLLQKAKQGELVLLPVKNKIIGEIPEFSKILKREKMKPLQTIRLPICFVLACRKDVSANNISKIYTSRVAKAQCEKYLNKNHRNVRFVFTGSTSSSYKKNVQLKGGNAENAAAIGSERAAKKYGLHVLKKHIEDLRANWTEFGLFKSAEAARIKGKRRSSWPAKKR